jgi:phospholipid/cholesterol/gamma-HCH transport system substrate-binding protein
MDDRRLELRVGLLVVVALAAGVGLLFLMGELSFGGTPSLTVDLSHTGNVIRGAAVKLAGVPVGRVEEIQLLPDRRDAEGQPLPVRILAVITPEARASLRADAQVTVASQGPLGESYLELSPGSASAQDLAEGKALRGVDPPRLDIVAQRLTAFLDAASKVLEDDPQALSRLVGGIQGLTGTLDGVLTENRGNLRTLGTDLSAAARDLRALAQVMRRQMEPGGRGATLLDDAAGTAKLLRRDLPKLAGDADELVRSLSAVSSQLGPEDGRKLKEALSHYAAAGARLDSLAARGERIVARIEAGEGSAGGFIKDPAVYEDLKAFVTDLKKHPWKVLWKGD